MIGYLIAFLAGGLTLAALVVAAWVKLVYDWWTES